jgi:hypothetical protein
MKQQRVAVQLFLSFCIDIKGGKGQKSVFWGVFCIFRGENESELKKYIYIKIKSYFLSEKMCV